MSRPRRFHLVNSWVQGVFNGSMTWVLGFATGADGWHPMQHMRLVGAHLDGYDLYVGGGGDTADFVVYKNGVAPGNELYNLSHAIVTAGTAWGLNDTTVHEVVPGDFLVAKLGMANYPSSPSFIAALDTSAILVAEYV